MTIQDLKRNMRHARKDDDWYSKNAIVVESDTGEFRRVKIRVYGYFLKIFEVDGVDKSTGHDIETIRGVEKHITDALNKPPFYICQHCQKETPCTRG